MNVLESYEAQGYGFSVEDGRLVIEADGTLLNAQAVSELEKHKPAIVDGLRLRSFVHLVQAFGVFDHCRLLDEHEIRAELDAADLEELRTCDRESRRVWAELLAYRLAQAKNPHTG